MSDSDTRNLLKQVGVALATCFNMLWLAGREFIRGFILFFFVFVRFICPSPSSCLIRLIR